MPLGVPAAPISIIRRPQLRAVTGLSPSQIDVLEQAGDFPMRVLLSPRAVGWVAHEVDEWLARRIERSRAPKPPKPSVGRAKRASDASAPTA